jgi:hypothetical protein
MRMKDEIKYITKHISMMKKWSWDRNAESYFSRKITHSKPKWSKEGIWVRGE